MKRSALGKALLPVILMSFLLVACSDDDPASPGKVLWSEVDLGVPCEASRIVAVDFNGEHGMTLGLVLVDGGYRPQDIVPEFHRLQSDGSWLPADLGSLAPESVLYDLALDSAGKPVLVGYQMPGPPSIMFDLRGNDPVTITNASRGLLTVDGDGSFMVAGGRGRGGDLWSSTGPEIWSIDDLTPPLTGTNDSGFRDVYIRYNAAVACGFDDGADTLQVILLRTVSSGWTKLVTGGPDTGTYLCVALTETGTLLVGGMEGAGGPTPKAFLSQRVADGLWAALILPDPELLHGVMDILVASDGSYYLACMGEGDDTMANLIHASRAGIRKEIIPFPGGLLQLGEAANGDIYAVGFRRNPADGTEKAVMLVKTP